MLGPADFRFLCVQILRLPLKVVKTLRPPYKRILDPPLLPKINMLNMFNIECISNLRLFHLKPSRGDFQNDRGSKFSKKG